MQPPSNPVEATKASVGGDGLLIRDRLPALIDAGWEKLTPPDKDLLKWLGVFFRKPTPGRFMMRIRMPNGFARSHQLAAIADLSTRLGNGVLDITTRQQVELRGYALDTVPEIFERLRGVDLTSLQTGMDNVRNINGCALSGLTPGELFDGSSAVFALDRLLVGPDGNPEFTNLPRKMNVTITGCRENCTHNESQDIALTPAERDGQPGFNLAVGGKMGSGGFTIATALDAFVELDKAAAVAAEIVRIFRDHGERGPRAKCRLAFLIAAWGLEKFRAELTLRLGRDLPRAGADARTAVHADHLGVQSQRQPGRMAVGCSIPTGRVNPAQMTELARLADTYGNGAVRFTVAQDAIIPNVPEDRVDRLLAEPLLRDFPVKPSPFFRRLVACTGTDFCNLAQIETKSAAIALSRELDRRLGPDAQAISIHWSGCPAACGNHQAADIGLRGMKINVGGAVVDAVAIYVGGRSGPQARAGRLVLDMVPCDAALPDVVATVAANLDLFKEVDRDPAAKDRVLMIPAVPEGAVEVPWAGEDA